MKNIKDKVGDALAAVFGPDHVSDVYPKDWANLPAIQFTEEDNRVQEHDFDADGNPQEDKSYVRYGIDVWDSVTTSQDALKVDAALTAFGLVRTQCRDVDDPSGMKHKVMKYEAIIDCLSDMIYWPNTYNG